MLQHNRHRHALVLEETYHAKEGDVCRGCNQQIVSCKLFVYSCKFSSITASNPSDVDDECAKFLLHRSCAELPARIEHPGFQKRFLFLDSRPLMEEGRHSLTCNICNMRWDWFIYCSPGQEFNVCIKCALFQLQSLADRKLDHPAHSQHQLTLVQQLASFECHACKVDDNIKDLSYICTECPFWMHKNCADAPASFQIKFHPQHPLILSYSLPQVYQKFDQFCRLCNEKLNQLQWLYLCPKCRFFAHFHCARSNPMPRENKMYNPDLVHLPAADELSMNLLLEQFVKALSTLNHNDDSIYSATKGIKHWTHDEHDLQLITVNESNDHKDDDKTSLLCDGCVKPIRTDGDLFFGCVPCQYFLHKMCAESPKEIKHHLWPGKTLSAGKDNEPYKSFYCEACGGFCNGIFFCEFQDRKIDIGCTVLPRIIKHESHRHQLYQIKTGRECKACRSDFTGYLQYRCGKYCDFSICVRCIMKPKSVKHVWDRHPLRLIYEPGLVSEHEHDFNCEFCSKDIDTNLWFYHCSDCDLSFHVGSCFEFSSSLKYSKIKFGATNIIIDELHPHSLTFAKNRKVHNCKSCDQEVSLGCPVLECAPCKTIFCYGSQHEQYLDNKKSEENFESDIQASEKNKLIFFEGSTYFFNLEDFSLASVELLGKGSCGSAYKCVMDEGTTVVVKSLREVGVPKKEFEQQMEILENIGRHPNIVPLCAYCYSEDVNILIYEYMPASSLWYCLHGMHSFSQPQDCLHDNKGTERTSLNWESRLKIALGAARGIAHIHAEGGVGFTHGNIKPSNILLNRDLDGCVSEAGLIPLIKNYRPSKFGDPSYQAPEVIGTKKATQKSDVYSFGVLLLEMLTGRSPDHHYGLNLARYIRYIEQRVSDVDFDKDFDVELLKYQNIKEELPQMFQIVLACVAEVPDMRVSMDEVVKMIEKIRQCDETIQRIRMCRP
ncbi:uncharacterized protein LOC141713591 [Apium graveolens]|uniref:uncharacterized protein LOC141713591 n=1 Tax=Apium graveolens TaxID=4045 RepID=UPI003D7AED05